VTSFGDSMTSERRCPALKRLASAVQLRPWPPHFKALKRNHRKIFSPGFGSLCSIHGFAARLQDGFKHLSLRRHPVFTDAVSIKLKSCFHIRMP
jgi:hypothetical protein